MNLQELYRAAHSGSLTPRRAVAIKAVGELPEPGLLTGSELLERLGRQEVTLGETIGAVMEGGAVFMCRWLGLQTQTEL
jgi:hypothetical protein